MDSIDQRDAQAPCEACTIVARNYLPHARVFARSLAAFHSNCHLTVLVIDGAAEASDEALFTSLGLEDLIADPAERERLAFIYDVTELSTAVKPLLLKRLLREGAASVLFFDPDIQFFASVDFLWPLAAANGVILTPHVLSPIPDDGLEISALSVLRAGVYNLGFIGVGAGMEDFLDWWSDRLRRHCLSDVANGLFVDQRWLDYVVTLFRHAIVRDPGCNVAYWNLHERRVTRTETDLEVNGGPLRFYHFSGFDVSHPHLLSKHQGPNPRILLSEQPVVGELCEAYAKSVIAAGHHPIGVSYGFGTLPDGTPIDRMMRRLYRRELIDAERKGQPLPPSPFEGDTILDWLNAPAGAAPRLSRYLLELYHSRMDLQRSFPIPHGAAAQAYLQWVRYDPVANVTIPAVFRQPEEPGGSARLEAMPDDYGINVAGYFNAELGVGEVARLITSAARSDGIPVAAILNDWTLSRQEDRFALGEPGGRYPVTLVCANADECPRAIDALPREMTDGRHRIGFWFWETERLPRDYRPAAEMLDEIWVASEYVAAAVRRTVSTPVHVCPVPVRLPQPAAASKAELGLPEGFVFLFVFDFLSVLQRKNPTGVIEAFCRAFRPGEGPTLVLKSINGHLARGAFESVRAAIGGRPDVIAMDGYLPSGDRDALMNHCDCYVSLHRAEGLGLTLAEAMALGKPTIATAYSGNMAFMTPDNSFLVPWRPAFVPAGCTPYLEGDSWADPDLGAAATLMRAVYDNPALARDRGQRARADLATRFPPTRTAAFLRERLAQIDRVRNPPAAEPPPAPAPVPTSVPLAPACSPKLVSQLDSAARDVAEATRLLLEGIPYETPSRFGSPGRWMRTAVLRLLRPYAHFEVRRQQHHLRSTAHLLACLRSLDGQHLDPGSEGRVANAPRDLGGD